MREWYGVVIQMAAEIMGRGKGKEDGGYGRTQRNESLNNRQRKEGLYL